MDRAALAARLGEIVGPEHVVTEPPELDRLSKDYYWFSPILEAQLAGKLADAAVHVQTSDQVAEIVRLAVRHEIPLTPRGAGTGNYGQAVPLRGGLVLHLGGLRQIAEIGDRRARVQAGVRLGTLERKARPRGQELRIYPSTYVAATVGGFVAGGNAGIGSVTWGTHWDGNVLGVTAMTMEDPPRRVELEGDALHTIIHSYGTTAIITEVTLPLAPATPWEQCVLSFARFERAMTFARELAEDDGVPKRLVSVHEWPIPSYFGHLAREGAIVPGHACLLLEIAEGQTSPVARRAAAYGGALTWSAPAGTYHRGTAVSDFSFNHTTLWAKRADPGLTYLQVVFDRDTVLAQIDQIRQRFPGEVWMHIEYMRVRGVVEPRALPILRFISPERLEEMQTFLDAIGAPVRRPHSCQLDLSRNKYVGPILSAKREWDPRGLLNPGKLALEPVPERGRPA